MNCTCTKIQTVYRTMAILREAMTVEYQTGEIQVSGRSDNLRFSSSKKIRTIECGLQFYTIEKVVSVRHLRAYIQVDL